MRKFIITIAALMCAAVAASEPPQIVGHIPMAQGGKLVLGSTPCSDKSERFEGYLQSANGKILLMLCWVRVESELFVVYEDGDRYTYPVAEVQFTKAFREWADKRTGQRKREQAL